MLVCVECGCCTTELGQGWVALRGDDPDDPHADAAIAVYCPVCAASEFGVRPDFAAHYMRSWDPPGEPGREHDPE